ncbi:hypothetical protein LCGC14_2062110 [marine sediment metagenome]|uniref:Uncharacterized protein n=1 Tax=marine sediment metagenome TaxID=412755 RepID=A0A0F9EKS2_9ZZZZ
MSSQQGDYLKEIIKILSDEVTEGFYMWESKETPLVAEITTKPSGGIDLPKRMRVRLEVHFETEK